MPIITSLLDTDTYKYSMAQVVLHRIPGAMVKYRFKCRSQGVDLRPLARRIREEIGKLASLSLISEEMQFLRSIRWFKPDFVEFLKCYKMDPGLIHVEEKDGHLDIWAEGSWLHTIFFEVPILAIVSEVRTESLGRDTRADAKEAVERLDFKIKGLLAHIRSTDKPFRLFEFGTRRRFSREVQEAVLERLLFHDAAIFRDTGRHFLHGTSNMDLARRYNLRPIGTMAHEFLQAHQALGFRLIDSQKGALENWVQEYRGDLGIVLTDVIGMEAFCKDFDLYFAKLFDGLRHDSGDPGVWSRRMLAHYRSLKIDPKTKSAVYSDSLDFDKAIALHKEFEPEWNTSFGIGIFLTNDIPGTKPLNNVLKMIECNGQPVAKLSDSAGKSMCEDPAYLTYLRSVFGRTE